MGIDEGLSPEEIKKLEDGVKPQLLDQDKEDTAEDLDEDEEEDEKEDDSKESEDEDKDDKATLFTIPDTRFSQVIGMNKEKKVIIQILRTPIENKELFDKFKLKGRQGVLLYGPPGTGKTYLLQAAAGEMSMKMADVKISDVMEKWVGSGGQNIAKIFNAAVKISKQETKGCMLFFDEVDALARTEENTSNTSSEYANTLKAFQKQMDILHKSGSTVFVAGATNVPWQIGLAMMRSGRFDYLLYVRAPNFFERIKLFKFYLDSNASQEEKYTGNINYWLLGMASFGTSPADIEKISKASKLNAIDRCRISNLDPAHSRVEMADLEKTMNSKEHSRSSLDEWYMQVYKMYIAKPKLEKIGKGKNVAFRPTEGGKMSKEEKEVYRELVLDVKRYMQRRLFIMGLRTTVKVLLALRYLENPFRKVPE